MQNISETGNAYYLASILERKYLPILQKQIMMTTDDRELEELQGRYDEIVVEIGIAREEEAKKWR